MSAPTYILLSLHQFFTKKQQDPHAPPSLFIRSCPKQPFLSPWMKKVLKILKPFANVEEVKQTNKQKWQKY